MTRRASLLFGAMAVPVLAWAVAIVTTMSAGFPAGSWWAVFRGIVFRSLAPDAFFWTSVLVVVAAPLAGVMVAVSGAPSGESRPDQGGPEGPPLRGGQLRGGQRVSVDPARVVERLGWHVAWSSARWLGTAVLLLVGVSALLTLLSIGETRREAFAFVATSHAALGAVALALAGIGTLCGTALRDPLDAAACSLALVLVASTGVLVAGTLVDDAPRPVVSVALSASPLVAMVSAADIDLVRMDLLYRISPLARLGVIYPSWPSTCGWYLLATLLCFLGVIKTSANRLAIRGSRED